MRKNWNMTDVKYQTEQTLYRIGLIGFVVVMLVYTILPWHSIQSSTIGILYGECPFYRMTHLYCPGCGGTRSLFSFIHGNIVKSIQYNVFVSYIVFCYVVFMSSYTIRIISKRRVGVIRFKMDYIYIGIALLVLNWIIKNAISLL